MDQTRQTVPLKAASMTQDLLPQGMALAPLDPMFLEYPNPELWSDPRKGNPGTFMRELVGRQCPESL
jgi:hypothetical protein